MFEFIERLRKKPYHTRVSISILSAAGITAVVALVWVVSFFASLKGTSLATPETSTLDRLGEKLNEGAELTKNLVDSWKELESQVSTSTLSTEETSVAVGTSTVSTDASTDTKKGENNKEQPSPVAIPETSPETTPSQSSGPRFEEGVEVVEI